jgi:hypothetical protein
MYLRQITVYVPHSYRSRNVYIREYVHLGCDAV